MLSWYIKSETPEKKSLLVRENPDTGLCYLDKMHDMGYFFVCFNCDDHDSVLATIKCSGAGIVNCELEKEEVHKECIKYFNVSLDSNDYSIMI